MSDSAVVYGKVTVSAVVRPFGPLAPPVVPTNPASLAAYSYYDADGLSPGSLSSWSDGGTGANTLGTVGSNPTVSATDADFNNHSSVNFLTAALKNATAANWTFLHDGSTNWTIWLVGKVTGTSSFEPILDTNNWSLGNPGISVGGGMNTGAGYLFAMVSKSTLDISLFPSQRTVKNIGASSPFIMVITHQVGTGLRMRLNGQDVYTDAVVGSYSSSAAAAGLRLGYAGANSYKVTQLGILKSVPAYNTLRGIELYLSQRYNISLYSSSHDTLFYSGNSIMYGIPNQPSLNVACAFPDSIRALLSSSNVSERSNGISGQTTPQMTTRDPSRIDRWIDTTANKNIVIGWEGTNDLTSGTSASDAITNLQTWAAARRLAGFTKVLVATILPRTGLSEVSRGTVNSAIVANSGGWHDGAIDVGSDATVGSAGANLNLTYYSDGVHPTAAGYAIIAPYFATAINNARL